MHQSINVKEIETAIDEYGEVALSKNNKNNMKADIIKKLKKSEEEIEEGEGIEADIAFKELRQKYGY